MHIYSYIHNFAKTCVYMYINIHIHIYIKTNILIRTYIHTYINIIIVHITSYDRELRNEDHEKGDQLIGGGVCYRSKFAEK